MDPGFRRGAPLVTPAKAGVQGKGVLWIPAFAGMTKGAGRGRGDERVWPGKAIFRFLGKLGTPHAQGFSRP